MTSNQLQQYIDAHNRQAELIDSLRKEIQILKKQDDPENKEQQAILDAYWFLYDVHDYVYRMYDGSNEQFLDELKQVVRNLEMYSSTCDPKKLHPYLN
jgi:uncharacterized protein (UPF0335 family)